MIPRGSDAISPAPHHDIYSIEDLRQLIYSIKEATGYKPVGVKIAAVHNVAAIASGVVHAGADYVYLDGFRGGTGAAPQVIRDHVGIPLEIAIAVVDQRLRDEGIRNRASIIAAGSIRSSADMAKAIALGADVVAIGTAALIALGCHLCQGCHTGSCSWGLTTQKSELTRRLDPEWGAERLEQSGAAPGATSSRRSSARSASTPSSRCAAAASACAAWAWTRRPARSSA